VLGGTGFLGRRAVPHLLDPGFRVRVATRHPERRPLLLGPNEVGAEAVDADVHDIDAPLSGLNRRSRSGVMRVNQRLRP
jgi:uncharacterized protein YbjT (DUF2867 family)